MQYIQAVGFVLVFFFPVDNKWEMCRKCTQNATYEINF